jgi:hypothetical protein
MPIDSRTGIFYETQSGGLCRMHSLNAFFEKVKITPSDFKKYVAKYDEYLSTRFNVTTSSAAFDLVNSDQTNLVAYILRQHKVHVRYYALNACYGKPLDKEIGDADFIFVYNESHIWGMRKKNGLHYKVDSMGGVRRDNISSIANQKNIGLLVPVDAQLEWNKHVDTINNILNKNNVKRRRDLVALLTKYNEKKQFLGDMEIPLGVAVSILESNMPDKKLEPLVKIIDKYNTFISLVTAGKYGDLALVLKYAPDIIFDISMLRSKK